MGKERWSQICSDFDLLCNSAQTLSKPDGLMTCYSHLYDLVREPSICEPSGLRSKSDLMLGGYCFLLLNYLCKQTNKLKQKKISFNSKISKMEDKKEESKEIGEEERKSRKHLIASFIQLHQVAVRVIKFSKFTCSFIEYKPSTRPSAPRSFSQPIEEYYRECYKAAFCVSLDRKTSTTLSQRLIQAGAEKLIPLPYRSD